MNLGKYIRQLLPEHETVIIPGFGAFISEYKPAQIDEATGEMSPPSKKIVQSKIKNNDGLLVGFVAEREGNSGSEALAKIDFERDEMLYKLDKGEKLLPLEGTGVSFYNENREIQFEPEKEINN
jgi:hypothetical protein